MWFWVGLAVGLLATKAYEWWKARKYFWRCECCNAVIYCPDEHSHKYFVTRHKAQHPGFVFEEDMTREEE